LVGCRNDKCSFALTFIESRCRLKTSWQLGIGLDSVTFEINPPSLRDGEHRMACPWKWSGVPEGTQIGLDSESATRRIEKLVTADNSYGRVHQVGLEYDAAARML